jgi:regulator of replication initiation timing
MAKTNTPADAGAGAASSNEQAQDHSATTATDLVVQGDLVIDGDVSGELPPEIVEQLNRAADNLETAQAENTALKIENAALKGQLENVSAILAMTKASLESEQAAHGLARQKLGLYEAMRDANEEGRDEPSDADEVADGIYVMLTSKIPDEKGDLAPRGRLAIIGEERAGALIETRDARPATRADVDAAKRPLVRI